MGTQFSPPMSDLFYGELIRAYIQNPRFIERPWLAERIEKVLVDPNCRFLLLTAAPGAGKTVFMAWLAHFTMQGGRLVVRQKAGVVDGTMVGAVIGQLGGVASAVTQERQALDTLERALRLDRLSSVKSAVPGRDTVSPVSTTSAHAASTTDAATQTPVVSMECPNCHQPAQAGGKFCQHCGAPLPVSKKFRAQCGSQVTVGDTFCDQCGARVE